MQDSAYQQATDRVAGKERVEKACHPHFIPDDVALDECELPRICGTAGAPPDQFTEPKRPRRDLAVFAHRAESC